VARGGLGAAGAALGLLLALAAGLALWRARLFGAGDAELLAAVGAFTGAAGVLPVLLWSLLAGGVLAVCVAVPAMLRGTTPRPMPYALALAGGTFAHAAAACSPPVRHLRAPRARPESSHEAHEALIVLGPGPARRPGGGGAGRALDDRPHGRRLARRGGCARSISAHRWTPPR
jgi:hypothetical protein